MGLDPNRLICCSTNIKGTCSFHFRPHLNSNILLPQRVCTRDIPSDPVPPLLHLASRFLRSPFPSPSPLLFERKLNKGQTEREVQMRWLRTWRSPSMGVRLSFTKETTISNPCAILRALGVNDWETPLQPGNFVQSHRFGSYHEKGGGTVTRDWFVKIWREEIKQWKEKRGKLRENKLDKNENNLLGGLSTFQIPFLNRGVDELAKDFSGRTSPVNHRRTDAISTERKLESLLSRNNLVIARDVEWANVLFAFEQESRYMIMDASSPSAPVGFIRETSNVIFRQLLRTRRPFVAHVNDSHGNEIFQVRRPFWLINSTIYVEVDGKEIGVVHRRWHLWRRIYDLYLGNSQFAVVENPGFWNWTFTLKDEEENVLAEIDRNWRGIGLELFTDAGQYVIRFGGSISGYKNGSEYQIEGLEVVRPLTLSERAVAVALAVSLDCDYFSRRGGWGLPIILLEE